ncbi:MAG: hypothetical protein CSB21_01670 [Deltaproteobacteria bacterium]|nr:MAG: hypothetical protein CSB21_01670 [Deltaproteobacteria bacterium]
MDQEQYIKGMLDRTSMFMDDESMEKIKNTIFAISGLGGVGAITAELLARWGVKKFRLLDMDRYDYSNLNRQLFATSETIGKFKVDVAEERIKKINPYAEIEVKIAERVTNSNVSRFVDGAGILIQNADYPSCKLFYIEAQKRKIPLVNGYATITGGRVQSFDYRVSPCITPLEKIWNRLKYKNMKPLTQMSEDEIIEFDNENVHSTSPSLNFVTNMVGCLIVSEAVKMISGKGKCVLYPKYKEFDLFNNTMKQKSSASLLSFDKIEKLFLFLKKV